MLYSSAAVQAGTFDKIERLAQAVKGKKIAYGLRLTVSPASIDVYSQIAAKGYIGDIMDAGRSGTESVCRS